MPENEIIMGSRVSFFSWFKLLFLPILITNIILFIVFWISTKSGISMPSLDVLKTLSPEQQKILPYAVTIVFSLVSAVVESFLLAIVLYYVAKLGHFNLIFKGDN